MEKPSRRTHSQLFTVRVWQEDLGEGQSEWRGWVKHVASGEERYFRTWPALGEVMGGMVPVFTGEAAVSEVTHTPVAPAP